MLMRRKEISAASEAIIREQRTLKKEKFLANPALIIGAAGLVLIVLLAIFVPIFHSTDPNAMEVTKRLQAPGSLWDRRVWTGFVCENDVWGEGVLMGRGMCGSIFLCAGDDHRHLCQLL